MNRVGAGVWHSSVCLSYQVREPQGREKKKKRPQAKTGHALFYRLKAAICQTKSQIILTWLYFQFQACLQSRTRSQSCFVSSLWLVSPSPGAIRFSAVMYSCFICVTLQVGGPVAWWIYTSNNHRSSVTSSNCGKTATLRLAFWARPWFSRLIHNKTNSRFSGLSALWPLWLSFICAFLCPPWLLGHRLISTTPYSNLGVGTPGWVPG